MNVEQLQRVKEKERKVDLCLTRNDFFIKFIIFTTS